MGPDRAGLREQHPRTIIFPAMPDIEYHSPFDPTNPHRRVEILAVEYINQTIVLYYRSTGGMWLDGRIEVSEFAKAYFPNRKTTPQLTVI